MLRNASGSRRPMAIVLAALASLILIAQSTLAAGPPEKADPGLQNALDHLNQRAAALRACQPRPAR